MIIIFNGMSYLASNLSYSIDPVCRVQKKIFFLEKDIETETKYLVCLTLVMLLFARFVYIYETKHPAMERVKGSCYVKGYIHIYNVNFTLSRPLEGLKIQGGQAMVCWA